MASTWQEHSGITFSWEHGGTPSAYLEALRLEAESLLSDKPTETAPGVSVVMSVAERLYVPVPVRVSLSPVSGPPANEADDVVEDLWTAVYLATLTQDSSHLVWILKFHASFAKRIMKALANRQLHHMAETDASSMLPHSLLDSIGDEARVLLVDACCNSEDDSDDGAEAPSRLTVGCVARGLVPFFKALVTSSSSSASQPDAAGQQPPIAYRVAIKAFMDSLHDESLVPTSPSLLSGRGCQTVIKRKCSMSLTDDTAAGGGTAPTSSVTDAAASSVGSRKSDTTSSEQPTAHTEAPRYRHQLFVDCAALFETVCEQGKVALLSKLQERLPIGPIFFVRFDHVAYASVVANLPTAALAEFATFPVAPQEAVKLCFYHQCFPELPSPVASLRAIVNQQKAAIMNRSGGRRASLSIKPSDDSSNVGGVTLLHFRILRRLLARTHDIGFFKEYVGLVEKELQQHDDDGVATAIGTTTTHRSAATGGRTTVNLLGGEIPICIPALYGAAAEFAFRPEPMTTQIVLDKLAWLLSRSEDTALQSYMLTTCDNDAARFAELWVSETHLHSAKKFKTRAEMMAFAITLFRLVVPPPQQQQSTTASASSNQTSNNATTPLLQRRASMGAFAQPGNASTGSSSAEQQHATTLNWVHIWESFFARLASTTAASLAGLGNTGATASSETVTEQRAHADELVGSLKGILRLLREASGRSGEDDDSDGDGGSDSVNNASGCGDAGALQRRFERAQKGFEGVAAKQPTNVKLRFYGLFKQATVGDINIDRPWAMDVAGRAKYDAWAACKGKGTVEAMQCYIDQWSLLAATM